MMLILMPLRRPAEQDDDASKRSLLDGDDAPLLDENGVKLTEE